MHRLSTNLHALSWINSLQITLADSGYCDIGANWHHLDVCSPYSRLYYICRGSGFLRHDDDRILLRSGHMYLIPIGYRFDYGCDGDMAHLYFHLNITQPNGLDLFSQCSRVWELPAAPEEIDRLCVLYHSREMVDAMSLTGCLYRDVAAFIAQADMASRPAYSYSELLQRLFPLIRGGLSARLTIASLAGELRVSESTLTKRFKAEMEMTLGAYIDAMLFQKAQQMLLFTDLSIGQIAEKLAFCDQFYFSRYFKQRQRETPSQYRKTRRGGS